MAETLRTSRRLNQLSARRVETVKDTGRHSDGGGLYLIVEASGAKRWVFMYRWREKGASGAGRQREMGLGPLAGVSLQKAREKAADARALLADGHDPIATKNKVEIVHTFGKVALDHIEAVAPGLADKTEARWRRAINLHAQALKDKPVDAITTEDILEVLRPIWVTKAETAKLVRAYLETILDGAKARGLRSGENPARWRGHLSSLLARTPRLQRGHHPAMPWEEVPVFMAELRDHQAFSARPLEFLILTAARTGQVLRARWKEIDFEKKVWTSPAPNMKMKKEHRTPLSAEAIRLLRAIETEPSDPDEFIFPGQKLGKALSNMTMNNLLDRMGVSFTTHGFRSAFSDWAHDTTTFSPNFIEQALAHTVGDASYRAYRRGDGLEERRGLMTDWATYCGSAPATR